MPSEASERAAHITLRGTPLAMTSIASDAVHKGGKAVHRLDGTGPQTGGRAARNCDVAASRSAMEREPINAAGRAATVRLITT